MKRWRFGKSISGMWAVRLRNRVYRSQQVWIWVAVSRTPESSKINISRAMQVPASRKRAASGGREASFSRNGSLRKQRHAPCFGTFGFASLLGWRAQEAFAQLLDLRKFGSICVRMSSAIPTLQIPRHAHHGHSHLLILIPQLSVRPALQNEPYTIFDEDLNVPEILAVECVHG